MNKKYEYPTLLWKKEKGKYEDYWNDEKVESVASNTKKGEYSSLEKHVAENGFIDDLNNCITELNLKNKTISGVGAEIASGSMWLTAHIMKHLSANITQFYSVDFSEMYVFSIGPKLLSYYDIKPNNLSLCLGSFYELQLPSESLDFIVMSQAFHHADDPHKLLKEMHRVLKKNGFLIMIGELYIPKKLYFKCYLNYVASRAISSNYFPKALLKCKRIQKFKKDNLGQDFQSLYFPPDPQLGDHYHLKSQYEEFFRVNSFKYSNIKSTKNNHLAYVICKQ